MGVRRVGCGGQEVGVGVRRVGCGGQEGKVWGSGG